MTVRSWILIFCIVSKNALPQKANDSLKSLLKITKADTAKLRIYAQLSEISKENDIPAYTKAGIEMAEKLIRSGSPDALKNKSLDITNNLPVKTKRAVLNYYGRLLNCQGIYEVSHGNNAAGITNFEKALKVQTQNGDSLQMAGTLVNIGSNLFYLGNLEKAEKAINESLRLYTLLNDKNGITQCYNGLSIVSRSKGNLPLAIDYVFKCLKISEELKDNEATANLYNSLSVFYLDLEETQKARLYAEKSILLCKKTDSRRTLSNAYNNLAYVYKQQGSVEKSLQYLNLSLKISEELGDKNQLVTAYNNIGVIKKDQKKFDEAIKYYHQSLQAATEIGAIDRIATANYKLGEVFFIQNNIVKALPFALLAFQTSKRLNAPIEIRNSAFLLKNIYEKTGKYKDALEMTKLYFLMKDSIADNDTKNEVEKKQYKYNYDKKLEADSIRNHQQAQISSAKIALQNAELRQQKIIRWALVIGIIVIAFFLIYIFNRLIITSRQKTIIQQQTEITSAQRDELEQKNKNILESIEAARDIQFSVFPNKTEMDAFFKEYFILFKPFENLSGDFLWVKYMNKKIFLVIGDCTGHGIPASLLTLLANEFLNKIILQKQVSSPAKILQEVNLEIYNYLQRKRKSRRTIREGMDIAISVIDNENNVLRFSGARIDMYAVNKSNDLVISKSIKEDLGKHPTLSNATEESFEIDKIKGFYFTTDGFKDQLKYRSNKEKYGFNGIETFIKKNCNYSFEEQKDIINLLYNEAVKSEKQIDDILVFGFKM